MVKILFGIQGTGNGHISRSRELLKELLKTCDVDVLISGRHHEVDVGCPVKYQHNGFGYLFGKKGGIDFFNSLRCAKPGRFVSDLLRVPVEEYDLVISDFEPLTAWASKLRRRRCISISHQAAFLSQKIPRPKEKSHLQQRIMEWYAPAENPIGLHFRPYDHFIETPIIREEIRSLDPINRGHYTVYLPSYSEHFLIKILKRVPVKWEVFSKHYKRAPFSEGNVTIYPVENRQFVQSLTSCEGLFCNAGFETPAEALYLGKKLLVLPMKNQYEQACNAEALKGLGIPVVYEIGPNFHTTLAEWIDSPFIYRAHYEHNTPKLVERILDYQFRSCS